jgi:hypothetical protein
MFILLLLYRARQVGGSVEHSEGKDGESVVAISRFLCGSPHPCRLRTAPFWPRWQVLSCVLTACRVFMWPGKPSSLLTTSPNRTPCFKDVCWRGNEARSQDFTHEQGTNFDLVGTSQMVVVRGTLWVVRTACWSGSSPAGCISIWVVMTLLIMSDILSVVVIS